MLCITALLMACDTENAMDCFQTSGKIIQQEVEVSNFERVFVNRDVTLIITQAETTKVTIETGENLLNDIDITVIDNQLIITDNNTCNFVRDFGITKVYVEAPNLTEIRSSTQFDIQSNGTLNYPNLSLISENFSLPDTFTVGDFRLNLISENLNIVSNGLAFFYLNGKVNRLNVSFAAGDGRFEGRDLIAQYVTFFHRGSNTITVNPQLSLTGRLVSTGNVIAVNKPAEVDVEEAFNGRLIFE